MCSTTFGVTTTLPKQKKISTKSDFLIEQLRKIVAKPTMIIKIRDVLILPSGDTQTRPQLYSCLHRLAGCTMEGSVCSSCRPQLLSWQIVASVFLLTDGRKHSFPAGVSQSKISTTSECFILTFRQVPPRLSSNRLTIRPKWLRNREFHGFEFSVVSVR